jgi:hypothetical protein
VSKKAANKPSKPKIRKPSPTEQEAVVLDPMRRYWFVTAEKLPIVIDALKCMMRMECDLTRASDGTISSMTRTSKATTEPSLVLRAYDHCNATKHLPKRAVVFRSSSEHFDDVHGAAMLLEYAPNRYYTPRATVVVLARSVVCRCEALDYETTVHVVPKGSSPSLPQRFPPFRGEWIDFWTDIVIAMDKLHREACSVLLDGVCVDSAIPHNEAFPGCFDATTIASPPPPVRIPNLPLRTSSRRRGRPPTSAAQRRQITKKHIHRKDDWISQETVRALFEDYKRVNITSYSRQSWDQLLSNWPLPAIVVNTLHRDIHPRERQKSSDKNDDKIHRFERHKSE